MKYVVFLPVSVFCGVLVVVLLFRWLPLGRTVLFFLVCRRMWVLFVLLLAVFVAVVLLVYRLSAFGFGVAMVVCFVSFLAFDHLVVLVEGDSLVLGVGMVLVQVRSFLIALLPR